MTQKTYVLISTSPILTKKQDKYERVDACLTTGQKTCVPILTQTELKLDRYKRLNY